jgi:hypothetical protein
LVFSLNLLVKIKRRKREKREREKEVLGEKNIYKKKSKK